MGVSMLSFALRFAIASAVVSAVYLPSTLHSQTIDICEKSPEACRDQANLRRIGFISGAAGGTYIKIADDIRIVLDGYQGPGFSTGEGLRITPMTGRGSLKNIEDLLYLRNTDVALIQADVLQYFNMENKNTGRFSKVLDDIRYIAPIYNEEIHVVCRRGACGKSFGEVKDIIVNVGPLGSGTSLTATLISETLEIPKSNFRNLDYKDALTDLKTPKSAGAKLDAMFYIGGKPLELMMGVRAEDGLELAELVDVPDVLNTIYVPADFVESDGYGGLMGADSAIRTLAVPAILAVFGGNYQQKIRNENLMALCQGLVEKHDVFRQRARDGRAHKKWENWNPSQELKIWKRHPFMEEALKQYR
jgi:uncharacterized protein